MAFMRAYVSEHTHRFLVADTLDEPVMCGPNHIDLPEGTYDEGTYDEGAYDEGTYDKDHTMYLEQAIVVCALFNEYRIDRFEIVEKYWGRMEAPGYLDCSDFVLGDTRADVAAELLFMHFDGGFEGSFAVGNDLDVGEVVDVAFLECLVQGKIK